MVPSLVDLCVKKWIDNVRSLANVGEIDEYLLDLMLPLCSVDQLKYVEGATKGIDLSPVTDKLWKTFYEKRFGNTDGVIEKMRESKIPFKWKQAYEYKEEEIKAREQMMRLLLEEDEYDYCGAGYNRMNSRAREEIDSLNSEEEEDDDDDDDDDYYDDDEEVEEEEVVVVVVDEESDVEGEVVEKVGEVSVEEVEEDEETDVEEEVVEKVEGEVSAEEVEEVEEEQAQIEEGEDDRDESEVGQEEDGCGDDDGYGNDYYDDGYGDYSCDDCYGDDYGYDDDYGCDYDCDYD